MRALLPSLIPMILLAGCTPQQGYPSLLPRPAEQDRVIVAPGDGQPVGLSPEEEASIAAELRRIEAAFARTRNDIRAAEAELAGILKAAGRISIGDERWSRAQMALSRLDDARAPLVQHEASLSSLRLQVDSLPAGNASRAAVEQLGTDIQAERGRTQTVANAAERRLS